MIGRGNIFIATLKQSLVWAALTVLALVSCTDEKDETVARATLYPAIISNNEIVINTRAAVTVENSSDTYNDDALDNGTILRVYAAPTNGNVDLRAAGSFRLSNGTWRSSVTTQNNAEYDLYAIAPVTLPGATNQTFNWGVVNNAFNADAAALTFSGLDILTTTDPMASIAAAGRPALLNSDAEEVEKVGDNYQVIANPTVPTITKGDFNIGTVNTDVENTSGTYPTYHKVWMAMNHLYAKATISFRVDAKYDSKRDIRIKSARIVAAQGTLSGSHSYSFVNGLTLDPGAAFTGNSLSIDLLTGPTAKENREEGKDYATLTTTYQEYAWFCFLPKAYVPDTPYPDVKLVVSYDVYDNYDHEVRLNQNVENAFSLSQIIRDDEAVITPKAGDHFKIKVIIKPTYLGQLIDEDASNDDEYLELEIE